MRKLALLVLVVPLAAACGGSKKQPASEAPSPTAAVKEAAKKTASAGSEHVELKGTATVSGQAVTVDGNGDFKGHAGTLHVDFNAAGLTGTIDAVLRGRTLYMRSPLLTLGGKPWLKLDLDKASGSGLDFTKLAAQDPAETLRQVGALKHVSAVGSEEIGGVETTHYRGRSKAGAYDVFVGNDDGYVHRLTVASALPSKGTLDATMDFSDFGKHVTITVPPASQTRAGTAGLDIIGG
jgi:hypothetical protein